MTHNRTKVMTGLDVLLRDGHSALEGKRIGLVTNHTAVTRELVSIVDALHTDDRFEVVRLFGPEHGVRGTAQAGDPVDDDVDAATGIPVTSLYGKNREPGGDILGDLDVILFDIQDAGARHYTYMATMLRVMQSCEPLNIPVVVLDRPNPITGLSIEGKVLEEEFISGVGIHPMPTRHGLTMGELALLMTSDLDLPTPTIIACEGWTRDLWWDETDLPFVFPSPNLPTLNSLIAYTATCIIEATPLSEGRGTTLPFEVIGAPWLDGHALAIELNSRELPGVTFRATGFTPTFSKHEGEMCSGVQLHITDRDAFQPVATGVHLIHAMKHLPNSEFQWKSGPVFGMSHSKLYGSTELHDMIDAGASPDEIIATWQPELDKFNERAKTFHLYQ